MDRSIQRDAIPSLASKNGSVLRKGFGIWHIARPTPTVDRFHREIRADYLNYH